MRDTLRRICELQPVYDSRNTPEMEERGRLVRRTLKQEIEALAPRLSAALGRFGYDFHVDASDGIGRKTELPWVRFCSEHLSPSATEGFYVVLHFSTDGSGVNIAVGCSSSKFQNGYSIVLPLEELDKRTAWARSVVQEARGTTEPFTDANDFGARARLPKSFERACALVKKIPYEDISDAAMEDYLTTAAEMLRVVYEAQREGRELSPADQAELAIIQIAQPAANVSRGQGYGLTPKERRAVELRAMALAEDWLRAQGYAPTNTSALRPYDFEASRGEEKIYVEVKGTTSERADAIAMTHGEVDLHRREKGRTALILVTDIRLTPDPAEPSATGGVLEALPGWDIDGWLLQPTAFRVSRGRSA